MPTPLGHALGGIAAGAFIARGGTAGDPTGGQWVRAVLLFAIIGMLPDIDLLLGGHRTATHSLMAVGVVGLVAWGVARRRPRVWLASTAAYGTHPLLDWLGIDTVAPVGIMVLWPFDATFYQSSFHWFYPVCREYWLLECWIAVAWSSCYELMIVGPFAVAAVLLMRRSVHAGVRG